MKKVLVVLMMMVSLFGLVACGKNTSNGYEITIKNQSSWSEAAVVEYYDISGTLKAEAEIKNGKASADLAEGSYIVQIKDAPESVDYNIVVLTSSNKSQTITLTNAGKSEYEQYSDKFAFSCGAIVLDNGVPQQGLGVVMCMDEIQQCLYLEKTDKNGLAQIERVSAIEYHVSIQTEESDEIMNKYQTISAAKRFYIIDLKDKI